MDSNDLRTPLTVYQQFISLHESGLHEFQKNLLNFPGNYKNITHPCSKGLERLELKQLYQLESGKCLGLFIMRQAVPSYVPMVGLLFVLPD